ncbi:MAG: carboxylesterase family protein [Chloroflexota bacterium]
MRVNRNSIVETKNGRLQGYFTGQCLLFAGIPYAAPPTGESRFRPPQPPAPWAGVRDATHFGTIQPQSPSRFDRFLGRDLSPQSEDSLFLNVWTPSTEPANHPVIVYIHGGASISGSGSMPLYHGASFAERHDIVFVTINYRLAELGSLYLGHLDPAYATSGNTALLDMIAALAWVRDNIAAFGGDPSNVTIWGQSAGARAVVSLMAAAQAAGLYHRVICHSVASITPLRSMADAIATTERFFQVAGIRQVADLQTTPIEKLLVIRKEVMQVAPPARTVWGMMVDDEILFEQPLTAVSAARVPSVPLLVGACADDYRPYLAVLPASTIPKEETAVIHHFNRLGLDGTRLVQFYRDLLGDVAATEIFCEAMADYTFRQPTLKLAERHAPHAPTYLFDFDWASPVQGGTLGAGHTVELPFAFHNLWTRTTPYQLGDNPPLALADQMHAAWSHFAHTGKPSLAEWSTYDLDERATMVFGEETAVSHDPRSQQRQFWTDKLHTDTGEHR